MYSGGYGHMKRFDNKKNEIHDISYDSMIVCRGDTELAYFKNYLDKDGKILKSIEIHQDEFENVTRGLDL